MNRFSRHLTILAVAVLAITGRLFGQNYWTHTDNSSIGYVMSMAIDQTTGGVYAGTDGDGGYRLESAGAAWVPIDSTLSSTGVYALAVNPSNGTVFAGSLDHGVYRSSDHGITWSQVGLNGIQVRALAVKGPQTIFAGTYLNSIYRSTDNGDNWTRLDTGLTNTTFRALLIAATGTVYAGSGGDGIFRSTDDGTTWSRAGLPGQSIWSLGQNAGGDLYAGTFKDGMYMTAGNDSTWTGIGPALQTVWSMLVLPGGQLLTGTSNGIYRSTNNGGCWRRAGLPTSQIRALAHAADGFVYAGGYGDGVYRSAQQADATFQIDRCDKSIDTVLYPHQHTGTFTVNNLGSSPVPISSVTSTDPDYSVSPSSTTIPASGSVQFSITFTPSFPGSHPADITISSPSTNFPEIMSVDDWGQTRILNLRNNLTMTTDSGRAKDTIITIVNDGNDTIRISSIAIDDTMFTLKRSTLRVPPLGSARDTIHLRPLVVGQTFRTMTVVSDAPSSPDVFSIVAGVLTRNIRISADSIGFGHIRGGTVRDSVIMFSNDGNDTIRVTNITTLAVGTSTIFQATLKVFSIPPFSSVLDTVRFNAAVTDSFSGQLRVFSNAFVSPKIIKVVGVADSPDEVAEHPGVPRVTSLHQNYPNPFNPVTHLQFTIASVQSVTLKVYDVLGRGVATLVDEVKQPGEYTVAFDASPLPSGIYYYRMQAGNFSQTRKLLLLK